MAKKKSKVLSSRKVESFRDEQQRLKSAGVTLREQNKFINRLVEKEGVTPRAALRRLKLAQADKAAGGSFSPRPKRRGVRDPKLGASAERKRRKR